MPQNNIPFFDYDKYDLLNTDFDARFDDEAFEHDIFDAEYIGNSPEWNQSEFSIDDETLEEKHERLISIKTAEERNFDFALERFTKFDKQHSEYKMQSTFLKARYIKAKSEFGLDHFECINARDVLLRCYKIRFAAWRKRMRAERMMYAALPATKKENRIALSAFHAMRNNIGWEVDGERWAKKNSERKLMAAQNDALVDLFERAGISIKVDSDVTSISAVTNIEEKVSKFRTVRVLPLVAARDRKPMLNAMRYWLSREVPKNERDYFRYGVVTSGELIPAHGELREALQSLARNISKWSSLANKNYGIEVCFRGSEFTRKTAGERKLESYDEDTVLYHPHANILYKPRKKLSKEEWEDFLKWTREFLGSHWKDNGKINNVNEIVKYVVKPEDLLRGKKPLDELEAKWLFDSLFSLNLAQPLGEFRQYFTELQERKEKIVLLRDGEKAFLEKVKKRRRANNSMKENSDFSVEQEELHKFYDDEANKKRSFFDKGNDQPKNQENILMSVTMPMWSHVPWAEPIFMIKNYNPHTLDLDARDRLSEINDKRDLYRALWEESGAPEAALALQMADVWKSEANSGVALLQPKKAPKSSAAEATEESSFKVHNSSLTVQQNAEQKVQVGYEKIDLNRRRRA